MLSIKELLPQLHTFKLRYPKSNIDNQIIDDDHLGYLILKLQHYSNLKYVWFSYYFSIIWLPSLRALPDEGYSRIMS